MAEEQRAAWLPVAIAGALSGAALTAAAFVCWQHSNKRRKRADSLEGSALRINAEHVANSKQKMGLGSPFSDEILSEQFTRNTQFFGRDGQSQVHDAFVIVVGLGVSLIALSMRLNLIGSHSYRENVARPDI